MDASKESAPAILGTITSSSESLRPFWNCQNDHFPVLRNSPHPLEAFSGNRHVPPKFSPFLPVRFASRFVRRVAPFVAFRGFSCRVSVFVSRFASRFVFRRVSFFRRAKTITLCDLCCDSFRVALRFSSRFVFRRVSFFRFAFLPRFSHAARM